VVVADCATIADGTPLFLHHLGLHQPYELLTLSSPYADAVVDADATINASQGCNCAAALSQLQTTTTLVTISGSGWDDTLASFTLPSPSFVST
jgi:cellobiose-specific phosphotransferase system component IIC